MRATCKDLKQEYLTRATPGATVLVLVTEASYSNPSANLTLDEEGPGTSLWSSGKKSRMGLLASHETIIMGHNDLRNGFLKT